MKIINRSVYPETIKPQELDNYLANGWYRMQQHLFTVSHWLNGENFHVDRVWWLRFHINNILEHRSHRKIMKACQGFTVTFDKHEDVTEESIELYERYIRSVDFEGYESLEGCLYGDKPNQRIFNSWSISVRDNEQLIAQGIIDLGEKSILAKVNFYEPAYKQYSLGKFLILKTLEFMRKKGFEWYYPGYVIVDRPKFDYKFFLGKESAEYYDAETETWKPYNDVIMLPEIRTEEEEDLLLNIYFRFFR